MVSKKPAATNKLSRSGSQPMIGSSSGVKGVGEPQARKIRTLLSAGYKLVKPAAMALMPQALVRRCSSPVWVTASVTTNPPFIPRLKPTDTARALP